MSQPFSMRIRATLRLPQWAATWRGLRKSCWIGGKEINYCTPLLRRDSSLLHQSVSLLKLAMAMAFKSAIESGRGARFCPSELPPQQWHRTHFMTKIVAHLYASKVDYGSAMQIDYVNTEVVPRTIRPWIMATERELNLRTELLMGYTTANLQKGVLESFLQNFTRISAEEQVKYDLHWLGGSSLWEGCVLPKIRL